MPKITFAKSQSPIEVPVGAQLMQSLMDAGLPVASSCGGEGVCCKCLIKIIEGKENLSPITELEADLKEIHDFGRNERVSCQTQVLGDIKVDADYW
jgi:2Fe-2S ferredoxin